MALPLSALGREGKGRKKLLRREHSLILHSVRHGRLYPAGARPFVASSSMRFLSFGHASGFVEDILPVVLWCRGKKSEFFQPRPFILAFEHFPGRHLSPVLGVLL